MQYYVQNYFRFILIVFIKVKSVKIVKRNTITNCY